MFVCFIYFELTEMSTSVLVSHHVLTQIQIIVIIVVVSHEKEITKL